MFFFAAAGFAQAVRDSASTRNNTPDSTPFPGNEQRIKDSLLQVTQHKIDRLADSLRAVAAKKDSLNRLWQMNRQKQAIAAFQEVLKQHPYFDFDGKPQKYIVEVRETESADGLFYYIVALCLYIALMRLFFYKYMGTMFTLFFRATLRQQQLREQMLQAPLPSLLMNIFFVVSLATYCAFLGKYAHLPFGINFWSTILYAAVLIALIYVGKYIVLNIVGWIFGIGHVTDTYLFLVFLVNKMTGIFLLPILVLFAFPAKSFLPVVLTISYILLTCLLIYRFIISYRPVRSEIKLTRFHFFLYLCAFEIAPLLLIYKVLLIFVDRSF